MNADLLLQDKSFVEEMKADILRRAAAPSSDEDEEDLPDKRYRDVAFEEDLDAIEPRIRLGGADGEELSDEESGNDEVAEEKKVRPLRHISLRPLTLRFCQPEKKDNVEEILVHAYSRDPKVFERGAENRRSKARVDLRAKTGKELEAWLLSSRSHYS